MIAASSGAGRTAERWNQGEQQHAFGDQHARSNFAGCARAGARNLVLLTPSHGPCGGSVPVAEQDADVARWGGSTCQKRNISGWWRSPSVIGRRPQCGCSAGPSLVEQVGRSRRPARSTPLTRITTQETGLAQQTELHLRAARRAGAPFWLGSSCPGCRFLPTRTWRFLLP